MTSTLLSAATLANIEEAGTSIMILTEGLEKEEFLGSRLTRAEVSRLVLLTIDSLAQLRSVLYETMPELNWDGWNGVSQQLRQGPGAHDEALWFAVLSLVPATLMWLRTYRHNQPELFQFSAP